MGNTTTFNFNENLDEWIHVGITRDGAGETTLFINGTATSLGAIDAPLALTQIGIGERPNGAGFQFDERPDDVRFYDSALPATEMLFLSGEDEDTDNDGLTDAWELENLMTLDEDGDDDHDSDGFNNRIEFLAGTDPDDATVFPMGDSDADGLEDGFEWLNFGNLGRDGSGDFDLDGATDLKEFVATKGILIARDENGSITDTTAFNGSSDPANENSQPDEDGDLLPDGFEFVSFENLTQGRGGDFDGDGFSNAAEFSAGPNPARKASTPDTINAVTRVAVGLQSGISEYSVLRGEWTLVGETAAIPDGVYGVTGHPDGFL